MLAFGRRKIAIALCCGAASGGMWIAEAHAANIDWRAPQGCSVDAFTTRVELVLGYPLAEVRDYAFRVAVFEERTGDWRLEFTLSSGAAEHGTREIRGTSCADVTRAGAVAAAMALQTSAATDAPSAPAAASSQVSAPPAPAQQPPAARAVTPAAPSSGVPLDPVVNLGVLGDLNLLGAPSLGAGLGLGLRVSSARFGLAGSWLGPVEHEPLAGRGGEFSLAAGGIWVCGRTDGRLRLFACAHYELGALRGRGAGERVTASWQKSALWQAVRPELGLGFPLSAAFEVQLRVGASVALSRPEFVLDGDTLVLQPDRLTARAAIGIEYAP